MSPPNHWTGLDDPDRRAERWQIDFRSSVDLGSAVYGLIDPVDDLDVFMRRWERNRSRGANRVQDRR